MKGGGRCGSVVVGLVLAVALAECAAKPEKPRPCVDGGGVARLTVSAEFSPSERAAIERAAARWSAFVGRAAVAIDPGDGDACRVASFWLPGSTPKAAVLAEFDSEHGLLVVDPTWGCTDNGPVGRDPACLEIVVMHEMGHMLGLGHTANDEPGIMRGVRRGAVSWDFTPADRAECVRSGVCR